jgi:competence ComEA-like helix-hairpin-helix protein
MDTRWFAVSGRELVLLAAVAAVLLGTIGLAGVFRGVYGRGETHLEESTEYLPPPRRIDVNQADAHELTMLRGVGPKTADAIVEYRRRNGPFASLEDLQSVHGIGPATVESIRPHAMCRPPDTTAGTD